MTRRILGTLAFALLVATTAAHADDRLALLIPHLYGPTGLVVDSEARLPDGSTHSAHFNSAFQAEFTQFNVAIASQLTGLPIPTPASGFTYTLDPGLGQFTRSTKSFGPILSDRADTVGLHKLSLGVHYQRFTFDSNPAARGVVFPLPFPGCRGVVDGIASSAERHAAGVARRLCGRAASAAPGRAARRAA